MPSIDVVAIVGIILVFVLLGVLVLIPNTKKHLQKKKRPTSEDAFEKKDWYQVSQKLEQHIYKLRKEIEEAERREKKLERELLIQNEKYKKVQEKLTLERKWQKKEADEIDKRTKDLIKLKESFVQVEKNLENEHGQRLKLEKQLKEMKETIGSVNEEKHTLDVEIAKLRSEIDNQRKQVLQLREENTKLSKKHDEKTFVAKSEYEAVKSQLKEKLKEIETLKNTIRREVL